MNGLLFLMLLVQWAQAIIWLRIYLLLKNLKLTDLTKEDSAVRKATQDIKDAKNRLPPQS
jgi:hypothetical protein